MSLKEYKSHIVFAIIAAILVPYLFEPVLNLLGKAFIYTGNSISNKYLDSLYKDIATGRTDYALIFVSSFSLMTALVIFYLAFKILFRKRKYQLTNEKPSTTRDKKEAKRRISFPKFIIFILYIVGAFLILITVISSNIKYSTINLFDQKIKILTPYINKSQRDILISDFSSMVSYNDYLKIEDSIEAIAKEKNITLPKQAYISLY